MLRKAAGVVAGLGLIGGAGSVAYNQHGDATVKIKDSSGHVHSVRIAADDGRSYSCPSGTHKKVAPLDIRLGRIKLTQQGIRASERAIIRRYPNGTKPSAAVIRRLTTLLHKDERLTRAYNATVEQHNSIINRLCKPA
jgi:hypothetical protein